MEANLGRCWAWSSKPACGLNGRGWVRPPLASASFFLLYHQYTKIGRSCVQYTCNEGMPIGKSFRYAQSRKAALPAMQVSGVRAPANQVHLPLPGHRDPQRRIRAPKPENLQLRESRGCLASTILPGRVASTRDVTKPLIVVRASAARSPGPPPSITGRAECRGATQRPVPCSVVATCRRLSCPPCVRSRRHPA